MDGSIESLCGTLHWVPVLVTTFMAFVTGVIVGADWSNYA